MKHILAAIVLGMFLLSITDAKAQSFVVVNDTIAYTATPSPETVFDTIVTGTSAVRYYWKVIACNFPADWQTPGATAFCDNILCYNLATLWPSGIVDSTTPYLAGDTSVLDLAMDLGPAATPGCYYVTVRLHNAVTPADSATETWYVCYAGVTTNVSGVTAPSFSLYPNPVYNELTVQYRAVNGKVEVCDLLGKVVAAQQCNNGNAVISLPNIPHGVYFVRFVNEKGAVMASKKFIKE